MASYHPLQRLVPVAAGLSWHSEPVATPGTPDHTWRLSHLITGTCYCLSLRVGSGVNQVCIPECQQIGFQVLFTTHQKWEIWGIPVAMLPSSHIQTMALRWHKHECRWVVKVRKNSEAVHHWLTAALWDFVSMIAKASVVPLLLPPLYLLY